MYEIKTDKTIDTISHDDLVEKIEATEPMSIMEAIEHVEKMDRTVELHKAIGGSITKLTFEIPLAVHMWDIQFSSFTDLEVGQIMKIAGRLCGIPEKLMKQVVYFDISPITTMVLSLLAPGLDLDGES